MMPDLQQGRRHACSQGRGAGGSGGGRGREGASTGSFRWKAEASQQGWEGRTAFRQLCWHQAGRRRLPTLTQGTGNSPPHGSWRRPRPSPSSLHTGSTSPSRD